MSEEKKKKSGRTLIAPKRKIGLVCSGGASKAAAFHLGVALALQEQGFKFFGGVQKPGQPPRVPGPMDISAYVGSSAGSIVSSYLAAGYSLENIFSSFLSKPPAELSETDPKILPPLTYRQMFKIKKTFSGVARDQIEQIKMFRKLGKDMMDRNWESIVQFRWLKMNGLFSSAGLEEYLRLEALPSNSFQDYPADLFIVGTQLNHSRKVVFGKYSYQPPPHDLSCQYTSDVSISQACAASTALPFIYQPYPIENANGKTIYYIDGEIRDTLSTHIAVDAGCDLVFASYTHQPYHYLKEIGSLTGHGVASILIQSIYLVIEQKINNHIFNKNSQKNAISAVSRYCKQFGVDENHRRRITEILEAELHCRPDVDTIYIHPRPADAEMFFGEHFSLSPKKLSEYVRCGFKATIDTLRKYDFADRKDSSNVVKMKPSGDEPVYG